VITLDIVNNFVYKIDG